MTEVKVLGDGAGKGNPQLVGNREDGLPGAPWEMSAVPRTAPQIAQGMDHVGNERGHSLHHRRTGQLALCV